MTSESVLSWTERAPPPPSALEVARLTIVRDLRLAFRKRAQVLQPLVFFFIVTALFPLGTTPDLTLLRRIAPGVLWVSALLASLLAVDFLFRDDAQDGTLEQYALSGRSLTWLLFAKTATHWLLTGVPLALVAPLAAGALGAPGRALPSIIAPIAVGTLALSLLGAIGAGLTLGVKRSGVLLSLITLLLAVPILIFGAQATRLAIRGEHYGAPFELLCAFAVLGLTLAPLAAAAAVRISLE